MAPRRRLASLRQSLRKSKSEHLNIGTGLELPAITHNYDARKGQEKGKLDFRRLEHQKPDLQIIDFNGRIGRGEWIRTTGLLVPKQTAQSNSMITEQIFSCKISI